MEDFFEGKEILITGGTGSLGKTLVKLLISRHRPKGIRVFSRDELKQWQMRSEMNEYQTKLLQEDKFRNLFVSTPISYLIGDVRNLPRLRRAFTGVDIVIHTAAMKQVPTCEDHPAEAIETNIDGAYNVMNAAIDCGVERVMNVSTDKAVKPVNLYGATKMAAEKLFINAARYSGGRNIFACCRYGNVLGSRGSVAHIFKAQAEKGEPITITHKAMTRFWITLPTVARFLLDRIADMKGGEVFVPKMKSMGVYDMAMAMVFHAPSDKPVPTVAPVFVTTGIRQGEKLHEMLFHVDEVNHDMGDYYVVLPQHDQNYGRGEKWELSSDKNPSGELEANDLLTMLKESPL